MPSPHLAALRGEIAADVLLPGDPARARRIAERILVDAKVVSDVRGNAVYTGIHDGRPLSVLASGMGMASTALYATELAREFGVKRIVRIGTGAAVAAHVHVGDVVIATAAHTDAVVWAAAPGSHLQFSNTASLDLVVAARAGAAAPRRAGTVVLTGTIFSTETFYGIPPETWSELRRCGTLAVEMESAALFRVASVEGFEALTVLSVSGDDVESLSPLDRETAFEGALHVALAALDSAGAP